MKSWRSQVKELVYDANDMQEITWLPEEESNAESREYEWTILHVASFNNKIKVMEWLIKYGVNVNAYIPPNLSNEYYGNEFIIGPYRFSGWTSLHMAASKNSFWGVKTLLAGGAKSDMTDSNGHLPLHIAIICNATEVFQMLIDAIDDINFRSPIGETFLTMACDQNNLKLASLLIARGAIIESNNLKFIYNNKALLEPLVVAALRKEHANILANHEKKISALNDMLKQQSYDDYCITPTSLINFDQYSEILNVKRTEQGSYFKPVPTLLFLSLKVILANLKPILEREYDAQLHAAEKAGLISDNMEIVDPMAEEDIGLLG